MGCSYRPALVRLTASGTLEPGYGKDGVLYPSAPEPPGIETSEPMAPSLLLAADGTSFLSGGTYGRGAYIFGLQSDGSPIAGFGDGGVVRELPTMPSDARPVGLAIGAGGAVGVAMQGEPLRVHSESFLLAFRRDGTPDASTDALSDKVPAAPIQVPIVAPLADGREGFLAIRGGGRPGILRFGPSGVNRGYGTEGLASFPRGFEGTQLLHGAGGRVFAIGGFFHGAGFAIVALRRDGSLDRSYGSGGVVRLRLGPPYDTRVSAAAERPGGSLLLVGRIDGKAGAVRVLPDGTLDRSFGRGGREILLGRHTVAAALVAQKGGLVVACSREVDHRRRGSILVRLGDDGRPDPRFARAGYLRASPEAMPLSVLASRGDLVTVSALGAPGGGVILRGYLADGHPDPAFGNRGKTAAAGDQRLPFRAIAAASQQGGRIVVLGSVGNGPFRQRAELLGFR